MARSTLDAPDRLLNEFRLLSDAAREQFLEHLVDDDTVREELEDLLDIAVARARSAEPVRPLEDVLQELEPRWVETACFYGTLQLSTPYRRPSGGPLSRFQIRQL